MGDAHHAQAPVFEMTYTVSSGTLNPSIPYHTIPVRSLEIVVIHLIYWIIHKYSQEIFYGTITVFSGYV